MSYLRTFGPAGDPATRLGWGLGLVSILVVLVISGLLLAAVLRRRSLVEDPQALAVPRDDGGMAWLYVGVGVSTVVLVGCAVWTMFTVAAVAMPAHTNLTLEVTAAQWWWSIRYESREPDRVFTTANEIHIPVGLPVRIELKSEDVIHSFWIPQLAGKMDVIPGQTNVTWLQADQPGTYRGQCGEYCGAQHAHMAIYVVAEAPQAYALWVRDQLRDAAAPTTEPARLGENAFEAHCAACHAVRGTSAGGILGPDLTHLMSRHTIAAGLLPNTAGNLAAWIADSQALKPGSRMPALALSGADLSAVLTYLQTLR
ncbi:MAG: cytochrome c oxidase subunit II [Candidatus Eremiobacteraeota bacterium]|nr:cytochrome c oxidase subunit II [Candidatus Eremiobacteraeota bacterium]